MKLFAEKFVNTVQLFPDGYPLWTFFLAFAAADARIGLFP